MTSRAEKRRRMFLATTALEDFWDTSHQIVFLTEACCRYSRRDYLRSLCSSIFRSSLEDAERQDKLFLHLSQIYESSLKSLASSLSLLHDTEKGIRYWRVLVGPWLMFYVNAFYDRFTSLVEAFDRYPDLTSILLNEDCYVTPTDTLHFVELMKGDFYNLQLYSAIMRLMGKQFDSRRVTTSVKDIEANMPRQPSGQSTIGKIINSLGNLRRDNIVIDYYSSYFPKSALMAMFVKSGFSISPGFYNPVSIDGNGVDLSMRRRLETMLLEKSTDLFSQAMYSVLAGQIPKVFLENYQTLLKVVDKGHFPRTGNILIGHSLYFNESLKEWAGEISETGGRLLGCQHGGVYGTSAYTVAESHETEISDVYYTWGWEKDRCRARVKAMPAPNLIAATRSRPSARPGRALFLATSLPRYVNELPRKWGQQEQYFQWQLRFFRELEPMVRSSFRIRPHKEEVGWDVIQRMADAFPEVSIETWDIPFWESVQSSRLVVCDHNSTTFLQTIAAGIPTVLFWPPDLNKMRPDAIVSFDRLREVGILHFSPDDAASLVNLIYESSDEWWCESKRQEVVDEFRQKYANSMKGGVDRWIQQLRSEMS